MTTASPHDDIPASDSTVTVRVIDSTSTIHFPTKHFFTPTIASHVDMNCPAYVFLVSHAATQQHVLFDLGLRKDYETAFPRHFLDALSNLGAWFDVDKDVAEVLDEAAVADDTLPSSRDINAIIWSHHHFDHTGNPQRFPSSTRIVVGPGFKTAVLPGFPQDPNSIVTSDMWCDRALEELNFDDKPLRIAGFAAFDYFGNGSFYILSTPGHAPGHISALARVTATTFVFLAGDAAHHGGVIRPSPYRPLPDDTVDMPSSRRYAATGCPCDVLAAMLNGGSRSKPFYRPIDALCPDMTAGLQSLAGISKLDGRDDTFVLMAHDATLRDAIPMFPQPITAWRRGDLANKLRWNFVDDFAGTVDAL